MVSWAIQRYPMRPFSTPGGVKGSKRQFENFEKSWFSKNFQDTLTGVFPWTHSGRRHRPRNEARHQARPLQPSISFHLATGWRYERQMDSHTRNFEISKREKLSSATRCLIKWSNYISKCSRPFGLSNEPLDFTLAPPPGKPERADGESPAIFDEKIESSSPSATPSASLWLVKHV